MRNHHPGYMGPPKRLSDVDRKPAAQPSALIPHARPAWYDHALAPRARECVRLAARGSSVPSVADWLTKDERGTWELEAMELLLKTRQEPLASKVRERGLSDDAVNLAVAERLGLLATEATLRAALKG